MKLKRYGSECLIFVRNSPKLTTSRVLPVSSEIWNAIKEKS